MNTIQRAKNILRTPKTEWDLISEENNGHVKLLTGYLIPLALIPAIAGFIGYGLIGYSVIGIQIGSIGFGIRQALVSFISTVGSVYLSAWVISFLADKFDSLKSFDKAFELVVYSYTPMCVAGILLIYTPLSFLVSLGGLYGLYLLYVGLVPMLQTPGEKKTPFFLVSLLAIVLVSVILSAILGAVIISSMRTFIY
ncbi:Yip1 family protein [Proteiniphilum acetatigenes]|uniref:Yip1 family protein n=1 Tax=Proteiniphilum acetatigenes TaxID=294710 RepID=UPI00035CDD80|nr:Yip1 family protein [Proteiniphilum acetatigenes]SFK63591.1 Yip1 domain-containing protein [Porphyromonadaceae bacterium KH3CP3RA]